MKQKKVLRSQYFIIFSTIFIVNSFGELFYFYYK